MLHGSKIAVALRRSHAEHYCQIPSDVVDRNQIALLISHRSLKMMAANIPLVSTPEHSLKMIRMILNPHTPLTIINQLARDMAVITTLAEHDQFIRWAASSPEEGCTCPAFLNQVAGYGPFFFAAGIWETLIAIQ